MRSLLVLAAVSLCALPCIAADPPARLDRYGDPLPPGAVARYGTLRNRAPISGLGIEKDGTVVTVGPNAVVRRWHPTDDTSDDPIQLPLKDSDNLGATPALTPDGRLVAARSPEKVFVWEVPADAKAKPKELAAFAIPRGRPYRFSPDGAKILVVTARSNQNPNATAHLCDIKTGKVADLEEGSAPYFEASAFSGDGKRAALVSDSRFLMWDTATGKLLAKHEPPARISSAFALDRTGDVLMALVYSSGANEPRFYDALTGKKREGLSGPEGALWVSFAPDGKTILVGDHTCVRWWDPVANKLIRRFDGPAVSTTSERKPAAFSPDGKVLVVHNGHAVLRWNAETGKPLFPEQDIGHGAPVKGVGVSPDGKMIATRDDGRVCLWDAATGKELWHTPAGMANSPHITFDPDGKFLYVGGPKVGEATKYDTATSKVALALATDPKGPKQNWVNSVRLSADGKTVFGLSGPVAVTDPGFLTEWDATTGERKKATKLPFRVVEGGSLSPDARFISRGFFGRGGVVTVADPEKDLLQDAKIRGSTTQSGCFSDDGKWLVHLNYENLGVEAGYAYSAIVISTASWSVACTIPVTGTGKVAISPDGKTVAVAVGENLEFHDTITTKRIGGYRITAGEWEKVLFGYTQVLRFTPDGTKLITGHADTTALVWPVPERPKK